MSDQSRVPYIPGLAGVPAARSSVCFIDGERGRLQYRGYPVEILADRCSYEEVAYLLLFGELPTEYELTTFKSELSVERRLKFRIIDMLKLFPESGHPMDALSAIVVWVDEIVPADRIEETISARNTPRLLIAYRTPSRMAAISRGK